MNDKEYIRVKEPDMELIGDSIHQVKGNISINDFAYDCGYKEYRAFYRLASGQRISRPLDEKLIDNIIDAGKKKVVSKDEFEAANGCISKDYAEAVMETMLPKEDQNDSTDIISLEEERAKGIQEKKKQMEYINNVSAICAELDSNSQRMIKNGMWYLYQFDGAVDFMKKYSELKLNEAPHKKYFQDETGNAEMPKEAALLHSFGEVLEDLVSRRSIKTKQ